MTGGVFAIAEDSEQVVAALRGAEHYADRLVALWVHLHRYIGTRAGGDRGQEDTVLERLLARIWRLRHQLAGLASPTAFLIGHRGGIERCPAGRQCVKAFALNIAQRAARSGGWGGGGRWLHLCGRQRP